eukprot:RCo053308
MGTRGTSLLSQFPADHHEPSKKGLGVSRAESPLIHTSIANEVWNSNGSDRQRHEKAQQKAVLIGRQSSAQHAFCLAGCCGELSDGGETQRGSRSGESPASCPAPSPHGVHYDSREHSPRGDHHRIPAAQLRG